MRVIHTALAAKRGAGVGLALAIALFGLSACATPQGGSAGSPNSAPIRAVAIAGAPAANADKDALLKRADIDAVLAMARNSTNKIESIDDVAAAMAVMLDDVAAGKAAAARARLESLPNRRALGDFVEGFVLLGEGKTDDAVRRAQRAQETLSPQLAGVQAALIREAAGDLAAAQALYRRLERSLDTAPPPEGEANSLEEALRALQAPQTTQILYRAALTAHRTGDAAEADRLYGLVEAFAPRSPDVAANRARLKANQQPVEPALDLVRGIGRWSLFLSEEFGRVQGLERALNDPTPTNDIVSPAAAIFGQAGIAYDPSAEDWTLSVAQLLYSVESYDSADLVLRRIPARSLFAADAGLMRAQIALRRRDDNAAVSFAQGALRQSADRYTVALTAANVFNDAGRERETIAAFDAALRLAGEPKERATALVARGYANLHFGRLDAAIADARAALAADARNDDVRIAAIAIFKDRPDTWAEGVALGRALLAENPDSVSRLNQLGYTLIHRDEGLEEGFILLHRGASLGEHDYAVIDSLGWAYYLYGDFPEALRLIKRADDLTGNDPNAEILDHLGDVYWRLDQKDQARAAWTKALTARPEAVRRRDLEAKLRDGLTSPAPVKRPTPAVQEVTPRERTDT